MALFKQVELVNFRLIKQISFRPVHGINLLCGDNATGKTSILEAFWYLSSGKSFRTKYLDELIYNPCWQQHANSNDKKSDSGGEEPLKFCRINAEILTAHNDQSEQLSAYRKNQKNHFLYAGNIQQNAMTNALKMPLLLITPDSLNLLGGTPQRRRRNLNWGCFYHYPSYQKGYARYQRGLKQRNALLKQKKIDVELEQWTGILAKEACEISNSHRQYLDLLKPIFQQIASLTLPKLKSKELSLEYFDSISRTNHCLTEQAWLEVFAKSSAKDCRECTTTVGIHRSDVIFNYQQQLVFPQLSRGEWKILASTFLLSQGVLLREATKQSPVVLVDDFSSELDTVRRERLIECIQQLNFSQCFVSAVNEDLLHGKQALTIKL